MPHQVGRRAVRVRRVDSGRNRLIVSGKKVGDFKNKRVAEKIGRFRARVE